MGAVAGMIWLSTSGIVVAIAVIMLLWVVPRAIRRTPARSQQAQLAGTGSAEDILASADVLFNSGDSTRRTDSAVPSASGGGSSYAAFSGSRNGEDLTVASDTQYAQTSSFPEDLEHIPVPDDISSLDDLDGPLIMETSPDKPNAVFLRAEQPNNEPVEAFETEDEALAAGEDAPEFEPSSSRKSDTIPYTPVDVELSIPDRDEDELHQVAVEDAYYEPPTVPLAANAAANNSSIVGEDSSDVSLLTAIRGPAHTEVPSDGEVPVVKQSLFGGAPTEGVTVHSGRAIALGAAGVALVVALLCSLLSLFGMVPGYWCIIALLVAIGIAGTLRYTATFAKENTATGTVPQKAPEPEPPAPTPAAPAEPRREHRVTSIPATKPRSAKPQHVTASRETAPAAEPTDRVEAPQRVRVEDAPERRPRKPQQPAPARPARNVQPVADKPASSGEHAAGQQRHESRPPRAQQKRQNPPARRAPARDSQPRPVPVRKPAPQAPEARPPQAGGSHPPQRGQHRAGASQRSSLPPSLKPLKPRQGPVFFDEQTFSDTPAGSARSGAERNTAGTHDTTSSGEVPVTGLVPRVHNEHSIDAPRTPAPNTATGIIRAVDHREPLIRRQPQADQDPARAGRKPANPTNQRQEPSAARQVPETRVPDNIDESDLDFADDLSPVYDPEQDTGISGGAADTSTQSMMLGPGAVPMFKATSNTWEPVQLPKPLHTLHEGGEAA